MSGLVARFKVTWAKIMCLLNNCFYDTHDFAWTVCLHVSCNAVLPGYNRATSHSKLLTVKWRTDYARWWFVWCFMLHNKSLVFLKMPIVQGCGVGGKISDSNLSKISTPTFQHFRLRPLQNFRLRLLNVKGMKFGCQHQWKSCCAAKNLCFNENFKINCTISTGIPI